MKFIRKPVPVEAVQWTGDNHKQMSSFVGDRLEYMSFLQGRIMELTTSRGMIKVQVNEWLVVGPSGEFYARTDEAFWKAHEEI